MPQVVSVHPSPQQLAALSLGQLEEKEAQPVAEHVASCNTCRQVVENTPPDPFLSWLRIARSPSPAPATGVLPPANAVETTDQPPSCSPAAESSVLLPTQFGRYHILRKLGEGGMGAVYLARDTQLDRQVALKVPHFRPGTTTPVFERFCREARTAAVFDHPNLCPVYDVGCIDGIHYLTMPYIEGKSLAEYIEAGKPLPPRKTAALVRKLALALQEAHNRGVIHRDLKPANIMINKRQEPIIMDFGLARLVTGSGDKLTAAGTLLGTPAYMSPEQVQGEPEAIGPGCDIYALGVILYQMLTGRLPFEGPITGVLVRILTEEPPPVSHWLPEVDPALAAICRQAMAKQVADRPGSMSELANALTAYLCADNPAQPSQAALGTSPTQMSASSKKPASRRNQDSPPAKVLPASVKLAHPVSTKSQKGWRQFLSHWPIRVGVASALILIALGLFFFLRTPEGLLKIEVNDHRLEIAIDGRNITIDKPVPLKPGEHQLAVKVGNVNLPVGTKIHLHNSDQKLAIRLGDMTLTSDKFTFTGGKDQVLKITLLPESDPLRSSPMAGSKPKTPNPQPAALGSTPLEHNNTVLSVNFSPDGLLLASGGADGAVKLWDVASGQEKASLPQRSSVTGLAFSPDGKRLAAWSSTREKNRIKFWNVLLAQEESILGKASNAIGPVAFNPEGKTLATAASDRSVKLWDLATGKEIATMPGIKEVTTSLAFSPKGNLLAMGSQNMILTVADVNQGKIVFSSNEKIQGAAFPAIHSLAFSSDGRTLISGTGACLDVFEVPSGQRRRLNSRRHLWGLFNLALSSDGRMIASTGGPGDPAHVIISDLASGKTIRELPAWKDYVQGQKGAHAVAFCPNGKILVSAGPDHTIKVWNISTWEQRHGLSQTSLQDGTKAGRDITKALAVRILPSLVLIKVPGDARTPLGVVTDFGVATVMPGSFAEVELLTLDEKKTFTGKVITRKPFPFCWIDSPAVNLRPVARTQATVPKPQDAFLVTFREGKAIIVEGKIDTSGVFSTSVEIASKQKGAVAPGPIFSAEGTCLGLSLRSDWNMPLVIYPLKQK